jgi:putative ABC transport system permease protein
LKIPLRYNLRSLLVRWPGSLMTAGGIGLTVAIVVTMMALVGGLENTFVDTGHDGQLVVLRQGSINEVNSFINRDLFPAVRFLPGVARDGRGEPLVSEEIVVVINNTRVDGQSSNMIVRGLTETGFVLRPEVRIVAGRKFRPGLREIMASRALAERFRNMALGETIRFARSEWKVVGIFDTGGTAYDSEAWADYTEISQDWDRPVYSSMLLRAESAAAADEIRRRVAADPRINLQALPQREYFAGQTGAAAGGTKALGYFIAVVVGIGACFAAMNMMYGAVMSRAAEIATLRAVGFRRRHVLASFLAESLIVGVAGGVLGCLLALPMHGISSGTANFQTYSEVLFNFRITPGILLRGLAYAAAVGALGGYLPARRAARMKLIDVIRE